MSTTKATTPGNIQDLERILDRNDGDTRKQSTITWVYPSFAEVTIESKAVGMGQIHRQHTNAFAPVTFGGQKPSWLSFDIAVKPNPNELGVTVLRAQGGHVTDVTKGGMPVFRVNVKWDGNIPHTREKDKDNFDIVLLRQDGMFMQLQVSLVTRSGYFWICIQEVYAGMIVAANKEQETDFTSIDLDRDGKAFIAPLRAENAAPGTDYLKTFKDMGPKVVRFAASSGMTIPFDDMMVLEWKPEWKGLDESTAGAGWEEANVVFYNLVIGWGFALLADGRSCRIHFSKILDEEGRPLASKGQFPHAQPMTRIAVKCQDNGGKWDATAIRILE
jgi:hypothetical protein